RMRNERAFAGLKPHIRRMAFQIIGPEPKANEPLPGDKPPTPERLPPAKEPSRPVGRNKKKPPRRSVATEPTVPTAGKPTSNSAIMDQYRAAKEKHPGMLLLFRIGDFYEVFDEDAETAHKLLGLTLTTRDRTTTMAGFPHHQLEAYLHKLLQAGQRVAICEP